MVASDHSLISAVTLLAEYPECSLEQLQQFVGGGYLRPFSANGRLILGPFEFSNVKGYLHVVLEGLPGGRVSKTPREVYFLESEVERLLRRMAAAHTEKATSPEEMLTELRAQGIINLKELAAKVDETFPGQLSDADLGKLLPATPGTEISYEGYRTQGKRLRNKRK